MMNKAIELRDKKIEALMALVQCLEDESNEKLNISTRVDAFMLKENLKESIEFYTTEINKHNLEIEETREKIKVLIDGISKKNKKIFNSLNGK